MNINLPTYDYVDFQAISPMTDLDLRTQAIEQANIKVYRGKLVGDSDSTLRHFVLRTDYIAARKACKKAGLKLTTRSSSILKGFGPAYVVTSN